LIPVNEAGPLRPDAGPEPVKPRKETIMVSKILIATDGSENAAKAVELGADLASKYGASVMLVHVLLRDHLSEGLRHMAEVEYEEAEGGRGLYEAISTLPDGRFPIANIVAEDAQTPGKLLAAVAERVLDSAEAAVAAHGVARIERMVEDGDPARRIVAVAEDTGADMIVSGARGLSNIKALFVGSVSHKLAQLSPVTCVSVR
jgi:nucleotide-binding universal stress UspA family protein